MPGCYSVVLKDGNKQIAVFNYDTLIKNDYIRALEKAIHLATSTALDGGPCIVELFHLQSISGRLVFDTESINL